jgi:hypothetical protein
MHLVNGCIDVSVCTPAFQVCGKVDRNPFIQCMAIADALLYARVPEPVIGGLIYVGPQFIVSFKVKVKLFFCLTRYLAMKKSWNVICTTGRTVFDFSFHLSD